jgi:hypothetical protein
MSSTHAPIVRPEPRWPAILAAFAAVALHFALPPVMRLDPPWVVAVVVGVLVAIANVARRRGMYDLSNGTSYLVLGVLTLALVYSVVVLLHGIITHALSAPETLRSATVIWATNVLVFASWYWRLDAGGPHARERREAHTTGAFLFPQMTLAAPADASSAKTVEKSWRPLFIDYLFVAFNTSTAFSPTDVPVLSRWAKAAMMVQASISFTAVVLLAARAVNIL